MSEWKLILLIGSAAAGVGHMGAAGEGAVVQACAAGAAAGLGVWIASMIAQLGRG